MQGQQPACLPGCLLLLLCCVVDCFKTLAYLILLLSNRWIALNGPPLGHGLPVIIGPVPGRAGNRSQLRESALGLDCSVPNSRPGCVRFGAGCRTKHFTAGVKWNWGFCRDVLFHFSVFLFLISTQVNVLPVAGSAMLKNLSARTWAPLSWAGISLNMYTLWF